MEQCIDRFRNSLEYNKRRRSDSPVVRSVFGLAVNTDNDIDLIWNNTSNQLAFYDIASPATYTTVAYGPYTGWQAIAVAAGP